MVDAVQIDIHEIEVTPVFKYIELEDVPQSEIHGRLIKKRHEVAEIRFAGTKNYSPVVPVDTMWKREGLKVITFAERWAEQYRAFKEGNPQEAEGTPLDMLAQYGITPEQISLCRVRRIYSVEALNSIQGDSIKSLGMHANKLKEAARKFMADRGSGVEAQDEIAKLRAELAAMKASLSTVAPVDEPTPEEAEQVAVAAGAYDDLTDAQIKEQIKEITGAAPRGNPSRDTLVASLNEALAA